MNQEKRSTLDCWVWPDVLGTSGYRWTIVEKESHRVIEHSPAPMSLGRICWTQDEARADLERRIAELCS